MKKNYKYWLRWIAVLPGSLIAGFLMTFPLHWILYFTLVNGSVVSGTNIQPIEYNLTPFVIAITYILVGFRIAPEHKFKTSIILCGIWLVSFFGIFIFYRDLLNLEFQFRSFLSLLGVFLGLYIAWRKSKQDSNNVSE